MLSSLENWFTQGNDKKEQSQQTTSTEIDELNEFVNVSLNESTEEENNNPQSTFEEKALASICFSEEVEEETSTGHFLKQALEKIRNLERECDFLYSKQTIQHQIMLESGNQSGIVFQKCKVCGDPIIMNSNTACTFHPGQAIKAKFKDLPDTVINAYKPDTVKKTAPEKFWKYSCCGESDPCCYDRHIPEEDTSLEESVMTMKEIQERKPGSLAFFHPTDSMVVYD